MTSTTVSVARLGTMCMLATSWATPGAIQFYFSLWGLLWGLKCDPSKNRVIGQASALGWSGHQSRKEATTNQKQYHGGGGVFESIKPQQNIPGKTARPECLGYKDALCRIQGLKRQHTAQYYLDRDEDKDTNTKIEEEVAAPTCLVICLAPAVVLPQRHHRLWQEFGAPLLLAPRVSIERENSLHDVMWWYFGWLHVFWPLHAQGAPALPPSKGKFWEYW